MIPANKPFLSLTAGDLMSPAIVVSKEMSLQGAARLLSRAHVTGAPVVNAGGRCVGVISATDFMHWAENGEPAARGWWPECAVAADWQTVPEENLPWEAVRQHMTADPVTVTVATTLGDLARLMLDAHIHRVIVVDTECRPVGVVSSTDVLAAVVQADVVQRSAPTPEPEGARRRAVDNCHR